eukprot:Nitzschia sp. Nitz4//scaffold169_size48518//11566//14039//NITZ4_007066-RA/size48518-snap-gene-0.58-mRNA-1//-1//CDS//3329538370//4151//frame0
MKPTIQRRWTYDEDTRRACSSKTPKISNRGGLTRQTKKKSRGPGRTRHSYEHGIKRKPTYFYTKSTTPVAMNLVVKPDSSMDLSSGSEPSSPSTISSPRPQQFYQMRDAPADDPDVFKKVFGAPMTLVGTEVGGGDWQEMSLDGSEVTFPTVLAQARPTRPIKQQMPSFQPLHDPSSPEEWSLPDEELISDHQFVIDGKRYVHRALPSGWQLKVSKSHKRPFYLHPDYGATWHCPVILRSRSQVAAARASKPVFIQEPTKEPLSFDGDMDDLIQLCSDAAAVKHTCKKSGYEGSISSNSETSDGTQTTAEESEIANTTEAEEESHRVVAFSPPSHDLQDSPSEWETPLRGDLNTPSIPNDLDHPASVVARSVAYGNIHTSKVQELHKSDSICTPTMLDAAVVKGRESTPRVSFESNELGDEVHVMPHTDSTSSSNMSGSTGSQLSPDSIQPHQKVDMRESTNSKTTPLVSSDVWRDTIEVSRSCPSSRSKGENPCLMETPQGIFRTPQPKLMPPSKPIGRPPLPKAAPSVSSSKASESVDVSNSSDTCTRKTITLRQRGSMKNLGKPARLLVNVKEPNDSTGSSPTSCLPEKESPPSNTAPGIQRVSSGNTDESPQPEDEWSPPRDDTRLINEGSAAPKEEIDMARSEDPMRLSDGQQGSTTFGSPRTVENSCSHIRSLSQSPIATGDILSSPRSLSPTEVSPMQVNEDTSSSPAKAALHVEPESPELQNAAEDELSGVSDEHLATEFQPASPESTISADESAILVSTQAQVRSSSALPTASDMRAAKLGQVDESKEKGKDKDSQIRHEREAENISR